MALTISNVNSANSTTASATLAVTGVTADVNDWLVVIVSADNAGTNGASALSTVTDSASNSYSLRSDTTNDPSNASAGISLGIYTSKITAALSSGSITINFSPNVTSKAAVVKRVVPGAEERVVFRSVGGGATGSTSTVTQTASSVANGDTVMFGFAVEDTTANLSDSDTTNGSWSTVYTTAGNTGTAGTSAAVSSQHKTVSATGDQTWDVTLANNRDWASNYVVLYPASIYVNGRWTINGVRTK